MGPSNLGMGGGVGGDAPTRVSFPGVCGWHPCIVCVCRCGVAGRYGNITGLQDARCFGACAEGYYCPAGSTVATQVACGNASW
jgi:hypothetical protein